ncbi:MAG: DNA polymerase I [Phycisphaeraceae bacterium]|nr:DNA polymerase I [Phycisphaeraceae bacterium]
MPTLYLIDGYAQFFRAYHAIRTPMTSPVTKEPTNMSFGFLGMLLKLLRAEGQIGADGGRPDYLAVAIDVSGDTETFRSTLYPEYKTNRPPPPEDLFPQVDRCLAALRAIGVPVVGVEGFEADDTIATLVTSLRAAHPDLRIRIISKDKDLKQLLAANAVEMYDIHTDLLITADTLKADSGLTPPQVIDMLALMGDSVDNVPGVEGVGPKTAAELITTYGTLDNLIAHADKIKGKRGERLREAIPRLALSRELVSLRHDAPVSLDLQAADTKRLNLDSLLPILRELGFNRYQDEVRALLGAAGGSPTPVAPKPAASGAAARPLAAGGLFDHLEPDPSSVPSSSSTRPPNPGYRSITTHADLDSLIGQLRTAPVIAIDTETTGLSPISSALCGISLSIEPGTGVYIPIRSPAPVEHLDAGTVLKALGPILADADRPKTGHNLKFDQMVLRAAGAPLAGIAFDSMIASYLIDSSRSSHSLDALALALLNHTNISITELIGSGPSQRTFDTVPVDLATQYAAEDADIALRLREVMLPHLRAMGLMPLLSEVETPLLEVLAELEWNGIRVDPAELDRQRDRLQTRIGELKKQIESAAYDAIERPFNPDSPRQLAGVLFNRRDDAAEPGLGLKPVKRIKTGYSTDTEVLEQLASDPTILTPIPQLILDYRQLTKLVSTYLVALKDAINPATGRIHASFNQTVAATGRLSSSDPNLQNIPIRSDIGREIRRAFVAEPGHVLVTADYSQIELRILAHLSRDPALIDAFMRGEDIHAAVAAQIHHVPIGEVTKEQRNSAKMVNFGIVYGITAFGLARRLGIDNSAAAEIIDSYKRRFSGITTFLQECIEQARSTGYVETMLKRRRPIPDIESRNPARRSLAERTAINSVVQGSAADLIKLAMIDLHRRLSPSPSAAAWRGGKPPDIAGVRMLLQIHDELVFEAVEGVAERARRLIVERMESAMTLTVPLKADSAVAMNWFDGK